MTQIESSGPETRSSLDRTLNPRSVAVVGISDTSMLGSGVRRSLASDTEFFFVHPTATNVFGHQAFPDLASIGAPVDAVFSAVRADRTIDVVEQAASVGAGGVITIAGGFAELGDAGTALQKRMLDAARAGDLHVVGPNGVGMINVHRKLDLTMLANFERRAGGVSAVTHSGAMIEAIAASGWRPGGVGLNLLISAGNEAVTDLADYVDYLAGDPATSVIALAIEKIRRPDEFFAAAQRCLEAGKPIVAVKLGRTERAQRMAASHTGTLTGDSWVYDVAMRQAGIQLASDIDDLVDRVQFLEQLPADRWSKVNGLAVLTVTGGFAQLASDLAEVEDVSMPEVERLKDFVAETIPGGTVPNPLDVTGFVGTVDGLWERIVKEYAAAPEFDALLFASQHADWDAEFRGLADGFVEVGKSFPGKPFIVAPLAGIGGQWVDEFRADGVAVGNGLRGTLRGLNTMAGFKRTHPDAVVTSALSRRAIVRPGVTPLAVAEGSMLPFAATMELLEAAGIAVAPWHLIGADAAATPPPFEGPYVVKLADVAHRTEHDAVRVKVTLDGLEAAVAELRAIAARDDLPSVVAVQAMIAGHGEVFLGIQGETELGPVVAFGLGGIFVEIMKRIGGRMAPMSGRDAAELIEEFADTGVLDGFRGGQAWNKEALAKTLIAASELAAGGREWIASIDVNPMIMTSDGPVAVDGLCLVRDEEI
ncbi:acetate--CoA ligase family protein [Nocardioides sp. WS12]|uniref:acetate--CoA ligase family protein n=1 Tax=Nocardioides sp. WS12 TaxID=2486272 RepID=UPI0015F9FE41|nr:acetate--CoA ligase family protein [Nocardioides sp. WS12]